MALESIEREGVSPLELFFDLVFVFAVSQLSAYLLARVTWRTAAETAVMLAAVFSVWAGLIALAVGNELVIAHPHGDTSLELALLLFGGPGLYLLAQTATMLALTRRPSYARVGGLAALVVAGAVSLLVAPFVSIALAAAVLTALVVAVVRTNPAS